jgi:transcriptional regulator with XRE-family HTH domain
MAHSRKQLSQQIRDAIARCGMSRYAISQLTGLDEGNLSKFMGNKGGLSVESIDLIADLLNLELKPTVKVGKGTVKHGKHRK